MRRQPRPVDHRAENLSSGEGCPVAALRGACRWFVRVDADDLRLHPCGLSRRFEVDELDQADGEDDYGDRGENKQSAVQHLDLVVWRTRHGGAQSTRLARRLSR